MMTTPGGTRTHEAGSSPDGEGGASRSADEPPSSSPGAIRAASPGVLLRVDVAVRAGERACGAWVSERLERACAHLGATGEVRLALVDDDEMAREHARTLGDPTTTDVITFDLADGASAATRELDADLLLCVDEARRRGAERGHAPERELLLYALHGVLHCLGEDDTDEASHARMHAREDEVLEAIGVGATYRAGGGGAG